MTTKMISLHTHSTFSLLDGYGTPEQIVKKCKELNHNVIALTDHNIACGYVKFEQACQKNEIKPIFGCEFNMVTTIEASIRSKCHLTVLAKNLEGYQNILKLLSISYNQGFYYRAAIDFDQLKKHKEGLIILSGCLNGFISKAIISQDYATADGLIEWFAKNFKNQFFLEVQIFNLEDTYAVNRYLVLASRKYNIPLVMTNDVHYLNQGEQKIQDILYAIRDRVKLSDSQKVMTGLMFQLSDEKALELGEEFHRYMPYQDAIQNTQMVADLCESFKMPKAFMVKFNQLSDDEKKDLFAQKIAEGWMLRKINDLPNMLQYKERLKYEFDIIVKKKFVDYFLVVADMVNWAKNSGIMVGGARGSAAGSLICYLMRITEVDPIMHKLIFERFIDITREDLPDIDLDFEDLRRDEIKQYLVEKYGENKVSNIIAYSAFKGRNIVDDITRVYGLPPAETGIVKRLMLQRAGGDARADMTLLDTFEEFPQAKAVQEAYPEAMGIAPALEGQYRQLTIHAAGVVVAPDEITKYTPIMRNNTISYDYQDASYLGLLKIDVLGLKTLRIIKQILDKVGMTAEQLYRLPLDDIKVYDKFNTYQYVGVFQFAGDAINNICRQMKFYKFTDIVEANALARPGALHSGTATAYFENRRINIHPLVDAIADDANGQILYQEQVMRVMREIGLMSWKDTAEIRKLISKSQGVEKFNTFKEKFAKGAKQQGLTDKLIDEIWLKVCTFGSWAFNKSHSVSYALLAYWTMWLKVTYPLEFYWSNLTTDPEDITIIKEAYDNGIKFLPINLNESKANWIIEDGKLREGFITIKGIGQKTAEALDKNRSKLTKKVKEVLIEEEQFIQQTGMSRLVHAALIFPQLLAEIQGWTHKINDLNFGDAHEVILAGRIQERNLRSLKEVGKSKKGTLYDNVWHEEWDKWVNLEFFDDTGIVIATVPRQLYNTSEYIRDQLWTNFEDNDIYVLKGNKTQNFRKVIVNNLYNLSRRQREKGE